MSIVNGLVTLPDGVPVAMRFAFLVKHSRAVKDKATGIVHDSDVISAQVIELNGVKVQALWDTLAEKAHSILLNYIGDPSLAQKVFTITRHGSGYLTEYSISVAG